MNKKNKIKRIAIFTVGNCDDVRVFSGFPYFFVKNLENKNFELLKFDISPNKLLSKFFNSTITRILNSAYKNLFYNKNYYDYSRSFLNSILINRRIKKIIRNQKDIDLIIFLTYSFSAHKYTNIPIVLFSDDTFDKCINVFSERKPNILEKIHVNKEKNNINNADLTVAFFPELKEFIEQNYNPKRIIYTGKVINLYDVSLNEENVINNKLLKHDLLFIGRKHYIDGCEILIDAFLQLPNSIKDKYTLHIVGLNENNFKDRELSNCNIKFYGRLNKDNNDEYELYKNLLSDARLFINPFRLGGTYLTSIEAMYFYTPIIVFPFKGINDVFGEEINNCGVFLKEYSTNEINNEIISLLEDEQKWKDAAINSHKLVSSFTWEKVINDIFDNLDIIK